MSCAFEYISSEHFVSVVEKGSDCPPATLVDYFVFDALKIGAIEYLPRGYTISSSQIILTLHFLISCVFALMIVRVLAVLFVTVQQTTRLESQIKRIEYVLFVWKVVILCSVVVLFDYTYIIYIFTNIARKKYKIIDLFFMNLS